MRLTEHHRPADDDANGCVLSDADLAILAAAPERYAEYAADVRREYAHVPDDLFRAGRAAVLRDLLAKPSLFHTAHAREHWEAAARANVEAELGSAVEAERVAGRIEQHAHVVLRLVLGQRRPELDRVLDGGGQVGHLELEVQLHALLAGLGRPDGRLVDLGLLDA